MFTRLAMLIAVLLPLFISAQPTGTIKGKIIEQTTKQPIPGVSVTVKENQATVVTDSAGAFSFTDLPTGTYSLVITHIGFQEKLLTDVPVVQSKTYYIETELFNDDRRLKEVTVKSFRGEHNLQVPVSSYSFSREEIFRSPGAQGDIFRAIGILPGVVSSGGQYSAIAVRGQGTADNVYMADDIPLFEVSHLEIEGFNAGFNDPNGGRFSIFAPRVIDNALFEGGGFAAQYGRKTSSYLGLGIKEGNKETPLFSGQFDLLGATLIYDGPSGFNKNTTLFATGRYQNFSLLEKMIGLNSVGTPAYGDYMIKTTSGLGRKNKLSFIAMFNPESFTRDLDDFSKSPSLNKDNSSNFIGRSRTSKAVLGLNLRTLTGKNSYWKNVLYYRNKHVDNQLGAAWPSVDEGGNIIKKDAIPNESDLRHIKNDQNEFGYRSIFTIHGRHITATGGVDLARIDLDYARILKHTDTVYSFGPNDELPVPGQYYLILQPSDFNSRFKEHADNASGYIDLSINLFKWLTLNPGVRWDYTGFAKQHTIAPRISGSIAMDTRQSINFAAGIYFGDPAYSDIASQPVWQTLKCQRTVQFILGHKFYFSPDLKLTTEGWFKHFDDQIVQPIASRPLMNNNGNGYAFGGDISLTKRLSDNYYGQVSYSYMQSKRDDFNGISKYDYIFSIPHSFSLLGSYTPNKKWIFSGKFRYSTGRPTDKYIVHSNIFNDPGLPRYSQQTLGKNATRQKDFMSLDLRADYKWQVKKASWTAFMDIVDITTGLTRARPSFNPSPAGCTTWGWPFFRRSVCG